MDRSSFERFISLELDGIYRFAYGYMGNQADAEDVVNDSVIKAIKAIGSLEDPASIRAWFFTIVANTAKTALKRNKKVIPVDFASQEGKNTFEMEKDDFSGPVDFRDPQGIISEMGFNDLVATLDEESRPIVILRFMEDKPIAEIADILGENLNTVKSKLYRALKKLKLEVVSGIERGGAYDISF